MTTDAGLDYVDRVGELPGLDTARTAAAIGLHRRLRAAVDEHRSGDYGGTGGYDIRPVVGDFQVTKSSAGIDAGRLEISNLRGGADERGDGTVPKVSAMPHELLDSAAPPPDHWSTRPPRPRDRRRCGGRCSGSGSARATTGSRSSADWSPRC